MITLFEDFIEIIEKGRGDEIGVALGLDKYGREMIRLMSSNNKEECLEIRKKAIPGSTLEHSATEKVLKILSEELKKTTTPGGCQSVHDDPFANKELREESFKKILSMMTFSEIRERIQERTYSNNRVYEYLAIERHEEIILLTSNRTWSTQECMKLFKQALKRSTKERLFKRAMFLASHEIGELQKILNSTDVHSEFSYRCIRKMATLAGREAA